MTNNELSKKVNTLKELKIMATELSDEITTIEDEIKNEMTSRNTEEILTELFKIRWTTTTTNRLDTTAFKKAMPELAKQFTRQTISKRFTIS